MRTVSGVWQGSVLHIEQYPDKHAWVLYPSIMENAFEGIMRMFIMTLGDFTVIYPRMRLCRLAYFGKVTQRVYSQRCTHISQMLFIIYEILVSIMLINLLIAMMARTYEEIAGTAKEWKRQVPF